MSFIWRFAADPWLWLVGVVAVAVRAVRPGLALVFWDEINLLFWSSRIAHHGDWIWLSNNWVDWGMSWSPIVGHSPLNNYFLVIPYLLTTDPLFIRLCVQLMGALSVVVLYVTVKRYFGTFAAVVSGMTLALSPYAIENVRHAINPSLAPLFIALWMLTGLLGYYENRRWAQVLHWLFLGIAAQNHPVNALLVLSSLILLIHSLRCQASQRRATIVYTGLGILIAALTYIPWLLGTFGGEAFRSGVMSIRIVYPEPQTPLQLSELVMQFSRLASNTAFDTIRRSTTSSMPNLWAPIALDNMLWIHTIALLLGSVMFTIYALLKPKDRLPYLLIVSVAFLPLLISNLISPDRIRDFYLLSLPFGTSAIWGVLLSKIAQWKPIGLILSALAAFVVSFTFAWLSIGKFYWLAHYGWEQMQRAPMDVLVDLVNQWSRQADDVVFLVDAFEEQYATVDTQRYFWTVIGQHVPVRVVDRISGEGIPISPQGTLLVSFAHGQTIRALFGNGTPSGALSLQPEQPIFLTKLVYPPSTQNPDFAPESASQFENGARILGADLVESSPEAIALKLHWTPTRNKPAASYHFSVRVVTQDGKTIGQHDVPSLSRELWRAGDVVISPLRIPLSEPVSDLAAVRVQVIMYAYPSIQNVNVVDEDGNALGQWLFLRHNSRQASR